MFQVYWQTHVRADTRKIGERYSAVVLIVLYVPVVPPEFGCDSIAEWDGSGEGLISLVGAFNDGLAGFSDNDWGTYGQALLCESCLPGSRFSPGYTRTRPSGSLCVAVAIAYLLYVFLFSRFRKDEGTGRKRAIMFELIHFPLTFGLLLLFGSIVVSHFRFHFRMRDEPDRWAGYVEC